MTTTPIPPGQCWLHHGSPWAQDSSHWPQLGSRWTQKSCQQQHWPGGMGVECPGKCWLVMACDGLRWLVLARPGSFCLVLSRCGSLWLVVARSRLPWLVPACPGQIWRPNSTTLMSWWPSAFWRLSFALALTESIVSRAASISGKFHQKSTTSTGACQNVDFPPLKLHGLCTPVWHVCCVASNKAPRRVTSQANTSSHGSIWLALACPGLFWLVLACPGSSWLVLACPGLYRQNLAVQMPPLW